MKCKFVTVLQLLVTITIGNAKDLPAGVETCHQSDPQVGKCVAKAIEKSLGFFAKGVPLLDMPPLDPMEIDKVIVEQDGGTTAFNLKSTFRDAQIIGLAPSKILRSALRFKNKFALRSDSYTNRLDFVGQYTMNGQILVLPITGAGFANVSMQQLTTRHDLTGEYFTGSDGNKYLNITSYIIKFKPKAVTFRFDNLFNGDKLLGNTMNKFMNDNWDPVFAGIIPGYEANFGERFKNVANKLFNYVPFHLIFKE